jgi:hypothetical protein
VTRQKASASVVTFRMSQKYPHQARGARKLDER